MRWLIDKKGVRSVENSYLLRHALDNVWCAPDQDYQYKIELHRVTKLAGEANRVMLFNRRIDLPILNKKYHVFTADRISPKQLKLLTNHPEWLEEKWFNTGDLINETSIFLNIYNEKGIEIPKFQSWYMLTKENTLIFAFEENINIPINYRSEVVYVRTYTNAFYSSVRDTGGEDTHYEYSTALTVQDILDLQGLYATYAALPGYVYCYVNGVYTNQVDLVRIQIKDTVEFIYDSSVVVVARYRIGDLQTFNSIIDNNVKYLLLRNDNRSTIIDYMDDVDIHIVAHITANIDKGLYFHRNDLRSMRMVTHRDYSLLVDNVVYETNKLKDLIGSSYNNQDMFVEIKVRNSGFSRPLVYENNRIHELYKLSYSDRMNAMIGLNALDIWKAENLENSYYTKLMDTQEEFTIANIEKAYGYNAISSILANTPTRTTLYSGTQRAILPPGLGSNSTFYEYDTNGTLLGVHYQAIGSEYLSNNLNTRLVEGIYGEGTDTPDVLFGTDNIPLPTSYNYRVYMQITGSPTESWTDVTGDQFYTVANNTLINANLIGNELFMVRSDKKFLALDLDIVPIAGTLYFELAEMEDRGNGYQPYAMPVPMGELDIFLNGKSLIKGLDYFVNFPKVYIVNKEYLIQPAGSTSQNIKVRFTGFCNKDLTLDTIEDYGFIQHGFLSNNNRFDIRDDKVMRITVDGCLKTKADVLFSEEHTGISVVNALNGKPYQIKDIIVPINSYDEENVYSLRDKSILIDHAIEDYLSLKLPQPDRPVPSAIAARYRLVSPFFTHIINDMQSNQIDTAALMNLSTDVDISNFFQEYLPLLDFDPITKDLNQAYVIIHPHQLDNTINLDLVKMRILTKLVRLYGDGKIELSPFVTL